MSLASNTDGTVIKGSGISRISGFGYEQRIEAGEAEDKQNILNVLRDSMVVKHRG